MNRAEKIRNRSLPVAEWPEADQAGWRIALQPADPLEPNIGFARRWRATTRKLIEAGYGHYLSWLGRSGCLDRGVAPADRVTKDLVRDYSAMMQDAGLAPHTIAGRMQHLGNAISAIALGHDWVWLLRGASRLHAAARPVSDKRSRMRPAEQVLQLGLDLMHAAEHDRFRTPIERAKLFRDGLLIALLISRPVRRANLGAITIGRHLTKRANEWWVTFEALEMKQNRPFSFPWPPKLAASLETYIDVHRQTLLTCSRKVRPPTEALWISKHGTPMTTGAIYFEFTSRTAEEFGQSINPHLFRHIQATDTATFTPAFTTDNMLTLGHASMAPAEEYYNLANECAAGERHQATIAALRKKLRNGAGNQNQFEGI